ncbi:hypothetical protein FHO94_26320 [Escherichia coli]|nr:hypothetical protein [Escherichia coli]EFA4362131.1 hypothetical protein [Escherichia coli]EFB2493687.1 hypothetical protein [Escherichia coli]
MVPCVFGLAGGASAVLENIEDSTRWRGASADNQRSHILQQSAALHAADAASHDQRKRPTASAFRTPVISLLSDSSERLISPDFARP